jgi:hypothetical protein
MSFFLEHIFNSLGFFFLSVRCRGTSQPAGQPARQKAAQNSQPGFLISPTQPNAAGRAGWRLTTLHTCSHTRHKGKLGERRQNREKEGLEPSVQLKERKEGSEKKADEQ